MLYCGFTVILNPKNRTLSKFDRNLSNSKKRKYLAYLIIVMTCLKYLARQGISIKSTLGEDNLIHVLKLMGTSTSQPKVHLS